MTNEFIFVVKPSNSTKPGDIVFYDQAGLMRFAHDIGPGVVNYQIGYIDPSQRHLKIHDIHIDTLKALMI